VTSISARLDRLPITPIHRAAFLALAFAYFFELGDLNTFAYAAPGIIRNWGINVDTVATITSASFAGMFFGAMAGGTLANRLGRKPAFILSTVFYSAFSFLNAFAWDVSSLAALRFITGIGLSSMTVIANTYIGEFFPARLRGKYMGLTMTIGLLGIPATAWVARFLVPAAPWGWRLVFLWGALGVLAIFFAARMVESPRWLSIHGRVEEADAVVRRLENEAERRGPLPEPEPRADEPPRERRGYMAALRAPHAPRTLFVGVVSIVSTLGFYGFMAWVPTLLYQHGFSVTRSLTYTSVIALCNPVGALVAAFLMERMDRKWFNAAVALWIAMCVLLYGLANTPAMIMLVGALVVIGLQASATGLYIYASELFATEIRSLGVGLTYGAGRLTNVAGPFVIAAIYGGLGYTAVFLFVSGAYLLLTLLYAVLGPHTTGRSLEAVSPGAKAVHAG
jgi:MFS transporter, putative metabolite:H+ symporter